MPLNHDEAVLSLLDGPPLETFSPDELQEEVTALLGDDDPLAVALVIEEAQAKAADHVKAAAVVEAELEPCRLEKPCSGNEPLSGTGRCMTCGAQRRQIEAGPPPGQVWIDEATDVTPETLKFHRRSDTEALPKAEIINVVPADSPYRPASGEPLTGRVKLALGLPDKDMAHLLGVARPTAQAYATGRLPEIIDGVRAEYLLRAVRKRRLALEGLERELQTIVNVSD